MEVERVWEGWDVGRREVKEARREGEKGRGAGAEARTGVYR